jgi:hypothetical protein
MVYIYYLSGFNNYYNRTILLPQSRRVADFSQYQIKVDELENFNPGDNVMTQLTVNYWDAPKDISDAQNIDYILISKDGNTIDSRWFALDRVRVRGQQWQFTLRRDLVADNYSAVMSSPCFIEKATLPANSPFLWNNENMTFNQIKQEEILLKDKSNCPWIVGYIAVKNDDHQDVTDLTASFDYDAFADIIVDDLSDWDYDKSKTYAYMM